jgi:N-acetylmuramoyl-L-alanine amidase
MSLSKIVIHCSDTPTGRDDRAEDIHRWHIGQKWDGIGYHYVICVDGSIERGRPEFWQGSHVRGHNKNTVGICLIGNGDFNKKQYESLSQLVTRLHFENASADIVGHYELDGAKTCPNFDVKQWLTTIGL